MCCGWGGMMGGWGGWTGWGMFGWIIGLLFNLGLLILLILGIIWLVRQVTGPRGSAGANITPNPPATQPSGRTCPSCGRPMAPEWTVCPYDGTPLDERAQ